MSASTRPAHVIGVPLRSERNINPHAPALAHQVLLQVAANSVQHLKFKRISAYLFGVGERLSLPYDFLVVGCQTVIDATLQQSFHEPNVVTIDVLLVFE